MPREPQKLPGGHEMQAAAEIALVFELKVPAGQSVGEVAAALGQ
jgi:hypothetical protein